MNKLCDLVRIFCVRQGSGSRSYYGYVRFSPTPYGANIPEIIPSIHLQILRDCRICRQILSVIAHSNYDIHIVHHRHPPEDLMFFADF